MSKPRSQEEEALYDAALNLKSAAAREAFLGEACKDDPAMRARLERLLAAGQRAEDLFQGISPGALIGLGAGGLPPVPPALAPAEHPAREDNLTEGPGTRIGPYKLLQKIGEGGCGVVYMAEQEQPVRRRAAVKVIKLGMDTKSVVARFEVERQALALMDHPNIARVLDAGATETGRPYFVMELVRGIRITEYCDQNHLDTRRRLHQFIQICHAIQHAHQKGIIHRDIKPSNILVTLHDGVPVPKVIDFGIAKATAGRLTDKTVFTAYDQFIGTPAYMSPEQAELSGLDIDTRSDIYSLGVLLYELLAGRPPFDPKKLVESGLDGLRRTLREQEPQRPSTMVTTLQGAELASLAAARQSEPPKLISLLRGDLDWIVMKALDKDRARRYQTANGLAMDLELYLSHEPVTARPPSRLYRFEKLVRRNRALCGAAGAVALALLIGLGVSTVLFFKEREAHRRAVAAEREQAQLRQEADRARDKEAVLRREAEARAKVTQAMMLVTQDKFQEADELLGGLVLSQPSIESAAVFRSVGGWHALHSRWAQAAQRFRTVLAVNQLDGWDAATLDYCAGASVVAELGNQARFAQLCRAAVNRFAGTANSVVAERLIKLSLLMPASPRTLDDLRPLALIALPRVPVSIRTQPVSREADQPPEGENLRTESPAPGGLQSHGLEPLENEPAIPLNPQVNAGPSGDQEPTNAGSEARAAAVAPLRREPPMLVGAYSFDGWSVGVEFNETLDSPSAANPANYTVPGSSVVSAQLQPDGKTVILGLASTLKGAFSVSVSNVRAQEGTPIAPASLAGNRVLDLKLQDFDTGLPFSVDYLGNQATLVAGGADIWEGRDSFLYAYLQVTNDFDYRLRVHSISKTGAGSFTRAGLMARDSLTNPASHQVTVAVNVANTFQVLTRTTTGSATTFSQPPNPLPPAFGSNSWVRLQRVGTVFYTYSSGDGVDWMPLHQFDTAPEADGPFANPIYLGIAVSAYSADATTTARVSDFGVTPTVPLSTTVSLALWEYRRGEYVRAAEWCRRCLAYAEYGAARVAVARAILALACVRLNQANAARSELVLARDLVANAFNGGLDRGGASPGAWSDWVAARVLLREATALLETTL